MHVCLCIVCVSHVRVFVRGGDGGISVPVQQSLHLTMSTRLFSVWGVLLWQPPCFSPKGHWWTQNLTRKKMSPHSEGRLREERGELADGSGSRADEAQSKNPEEI